MGKVQPPCEFGVWLVFAVEFYFFKQKFEKKIFKDIVVIVKIRKYLKKISNTHNLYQIL